MSDSPVTTTPANSDYVVVARRYRPQTFEELIGQQHVYKALTGAIASDRVGHAYLFTGARGVGKTSAARILAKALNCVDGPAEKPCNECEICVSVSTGDDVDVLEIDGASNRGIDEIRQLRQNVAVRPSRARFKIYIIDEVHMLTKEAFNALLKTLEEPPEHVKFIFATTEPNKIPITILSRCQRYDFAGIETASIQSRLAQIAAAEGVEVEDDALQILAMRAAGSMRDSQSLLEQLLSTGSRSITTTDVTELLGIAPAARLSRLVEPLVAKDAATALAELDGAVSEGAEVGQIIDQLLGYFRDVMTQAVGCDESQLLYALPGQRDEIRSVADRLGVETLLAIAQVLDQTAARLRLSTQTRTLAEMAIVRICHLENLDELAALVKQLAEGGETLVSAPTSKKNGVTHPPAAKPVAPPEVRERHVDSGTTELGNGDAGNGDADRRVASAVSAIRPAELAPQADSNRSTAQPVAPATPAPMNGSAAATVATDRPAVRPDAGELEQPELNQRELKQPETDEQDPDELRQPAVVEAKAETAPLEASNVEAIWAKAVAGMTGIVAENAASANRISLDERGRLVASFPEQLKFSRDSCERPANRSRIEAALAEVCGQTVRLALATHDDPDAAKRPTISPVEERRQQQSDAAATPFVQKAMELFEGDPGRLRYIPPRDIPPKDDPPQN